MKTIEDTIDELKESIKSGRKHIDLVMDELNKLSIKGQNIISEKEKLNSYALIHEGMKEITRCEKLVELYERHKYNVDDDMIKTFYTEFEENWNNESKKTKI